MSNQRTSTDEYRFRNETLRAHYRLSLWPDEQAEAIIRHYNALGTLVFALNRALDFLPSDNKSELIEEGIRQIKNSHAINLGIPLEWKKIIPGSRKVK